MTYETADKKTRDFIRNRDQGKCVRCRREGTDVSHFKGRSANGTRWYPDNLDLLCRICHQEWETKKGGEYREFKIKELGKERFDKLEQRAKYMSRYDALVEAEELLKN